MRIISEDLEKALKNPRVFRLEKTDEGINQTVDGVIIQSRKIEWDKGNCHECRLPLEVKSEDVIKGYVQCSFCNLGHEIEGAFEKELQFARGIKIITGEPW